MMSRDYNSANPGTFHQSEEHWIVTDSAPVRIMMERGNLRGISLKSVGVL